MKATEYSKIDTTFLNIENTTVSMCDKSKVDYYNFLSVFQTLLLNYNKAKIKISVVSALDFSNYIKVRSVLNKLDIGSKEGEMLVAEASFKSIKSKLFTYLDKIEDAYSFILFPVYDYGTGYDCKSYVDQRHGYRKRIHTGTHNLSIACDYAMYKILKNIDL